MLHFFQWLIKHDNILFKIMFEIFIKLSLYWKEQKKNTNNNIVKVYSLRVSVITVNFITVVFSEIVFTLPSFSVKNVFLTCLIKVKTSTTKVILAYHLGLHCITFSRIKYNKWFFILNLQFVYKR